jgi:peptide/nickel transport system permease protein
LTAYVIRRCLQAIVVVFLVAFVVFMMMRLLPGDPILLYMSQDEFGSIPTQEEIDIVRHEFGVDRPLLVQFVDWVGGVLQGDLGDSIFFGSSVSEEIGRALPKTLYVGIVAWIVAHLIGVPAGIVCAVRRGKWQDTVITALANLGITVPIFWLGIILIYIFGIKLRVLPIQGYTSPVDDLGQSIKQLILPAFCLALPHLSGSTRQTRSAMLETTREDFVRTAWAKGLSEKTIVIKHVIRNGIIPVVTLAGMTIPSLFGGAVLIENVFNIPGMGRLAVSGLWNRDYAIVQGVVLVTAIITVLVNLLVDISYGWIDPRIREH